jgi:intracellular sulfur oxidation DsrE/DsrF family protein
MKRFASRMLVAATLGIPLLVASGCAPMGTVGSNSNTVDGRIPVVLHVTSGSPAAWNQALNNAANFQKALGSDKVFIEVVVNGPGINMLKGESKVEPRVTGALTNGVKIVACQQTMKALKLTNADMIPGIGYVPGGIVEVVERQRDGWSYVHY